MVNVSIEAVTYEMPKGVDGEVVLDVTKLPQESVDYLLRYGVRQRLGDKVAAIKEADFKTRAAFEDAIRAAVNEQVDKLLAGDIREGGGGGATLSPFESACREAFIQLMVNQKMKKADAEKASKKWRAFIAERQADMCRTLGLDDAEREARVAERVKLVEDEANARLKRVASLKIEM